MKKITILILVLFLSSCALNKNQKIEFRSVSEIVSQAENPYDRYRVADILQHKMNFAGKSLNIDIQRLELPNIVEFSIDEFKYHFPHIEFSRTYLYNFYYKSIFVPEKITFKSMQDPVKGSLIVHEMIHYIQHNRLNIKELYCINELEKDAIIAQIKYLQRRDKYITFNKEEYIELRTHCETDYNPFRESVELQIPYLNYIKSLK